MSYPALIGQSNPLASGDNRDFRAPAVVAGEALFGNQVEQAQLEVVTREKLRVISPEAVTMEELQRSRCRQAAIENVQAQVAYPFGDGAVLDAIKGLGKDMSSVKENVTTLNENVTTLKEDMSSVKQDMTNMKQDMTNMKQDMSTSLMEDLGRQFHALSHNHWARLSNHVEGNWRQLVVERPGRNPIGVVPISHPASRDFVHNMTIAQIQELEDQFNLPTGHFAADTIATRRGKVFRYLTEGGFMG